MGVLTATCNFASIAQLSLLRQWQNLLLQAREGPIVRHPREIVWVVNHAYLFATLAVGGLAGVATQTTSLSAAV